MNNNIQPTHENIHTGLSGLNNDEKWQDMLNLRSAQNCTSVVPHKFLMVNADKAGLHTIVPSLKGHNLALGTCASFGFVAADSVCPYPLWRLSQRYLGENGSRGEQSQRLVVQGSYTGSEPIKLRVQYIDGKLVPFWKVKSAPVVEVEEEETDYGCGEAQDQVDIKYSIIDHDTSEPIKNARVRLIRVGQVLYDDRTNELGRVKFKDIRPGFYRILITKDGYTDFEESKSLKASFTYERDLVLILDPWELEYKFYETADYVKNGTPEYRALSDHRADASVFSFNNNIFNTVIPGKNFQMVKVWPPVPGLPGTCDVGEWWIDPTDNNIYECNELRIYAELNPPSATPYWFLIGPGLASPPDHVVILNTYEVGDKVSYEGNRYICTVEHLADPTIPPTNASWWDLLP
jgi:hypothetical protein